MRNSFLFFCIAVLSFLFSKAQVGIGTETPDSSSILDVVSSQKGVLMPRMTTSERTTISNPANGLTVFDTDEQTYYFYNADAPQWEQISTSRLKRTNYQLIQSEDDFPAPTSGTITLDSNTFYEINGMITLQNPIELDGAYLSGFDSFQDGLVKTSGDLFTGTTGGSIRFLSLSGGGSGNAFNITGGSSLIVQNSIIKNFSKVGTISDMGLVFFSIIQYLNNSDGFTYKNISDLLISNAAWQGNNSGIFEKFEGSFDLVQKSSGFSVANGGAVAIDVSANPSVTTGVISGTAFSGDSPSYINKYTSTTAGVNFTNSWFVQTPGIKDEFDDIATGNIYFAGSLTSGYGQSVVGNSAFKLTGATTSSNLLRFTDDNINNRLTYNGKNRRTFTVNASVGVRGTDSAGVFYSFFIRKVTPSSSVTLAETNSIFYVDNITNIGSISITGTVELEPGQSVELWGQRLTGNGNSNISVFSQNLTID